MLPVLNHNVSEYCFNSSYPKEAGGVTDHNILKARIFSSTMSALSMVGALLIIISYVAIKDIRTNARFILLHLSIGDFGVGLVNFIGAVVYFDKYINTWCCHSDSIMGKCHMYLGMCQTQAFFASYFTQASILWTLVLSLYVYILVVYAGSRATLSKGLMRCSYVICWGLPLCVSLWFVLSDRLGVTRVGGGGWCSLRASDTDGNVSVFTVFFGSDVWVISVFILILVLYTSTHCHLKLKIQEMKDIYNVSDEQLRQFSSDQKLLLIPFFFLILRIGSILISVVYVYTHLWRKMSHTWHVTIFYAMAIGDSSQGLVNGFIFCLLTYKVRQKLCFLPLLYVKQRKSSPSLTETVEQRKLLENIDVSYSYSSTTRSMNKSLSSYYDEQ